MTPAEALRPLEAALLDHHGGDRGRSLRLHFEDGSVEDVAVAWFFRTVAEMDALDRRALELARGRVLDVGAGAGPHALALQAAGHDVTALETLPGCVTVMRERGLRDARNADVFDWRPERPYDTVLLLMNGTGLAGTRAGLPRLLRRAGGLLAPGGRLLVDSTDPGDGDPGDGRHPGELHLQLEYRGERGPPFPHLYVGPAELAAVARAEGLAAEVVLSLPDGRFLATCRAEGVVSP